MGILTSGQIAVKPFRLATSATLDQIAEYAATRRYPLSRDEPSSGWGSIGDDDSALGLPVSVGVGAGIAEVETGFESGPARRLRLRYYWAAVDSRAMRATDQRTNWRVVNVLNGADIVLYEETSGLYSGLITMRTPSPFNLILGALKSLILTLDDTPELVSDTVPEALSEDFFLWLVDRDEASDDEPIADGYSLLSIVEISSKDRQFRSARFKDTANAERIELAALIARGRVGFGPAKVTLNSDVHEATFEVEFHLDGGFQPLRSSEYDEENFSAEALGSALVDDIWTDVLPSLRKSYDDDHGWQNSRRAALRESAVDTICEQLNLVRR